MSVMSNFTPSCHIGSGINFVDAKLNCRSLACTNSRAGIRLTKPFENDSFRISRIALPSSSRVSRRGSMRMALEDEKLARGRNVAEPPRILACELVQGALVKWSSMIDKSVPDAPTAVFLRGVLGSQKNWVDGGRAVLLDQLDSWNFCPEIGKRISNMADILYSNLGFLLVDLWCHGDSASIKKRGSQTVASSALDVLKLVWVLDATPGKVQAGGDSEDHAVELISFLSKLPKEIHADNSDGLFRILPSSFKL